MLDLGLKLAVVAGAMVAVSGGVLAYGHHRESVGAARVQSAWDREKVSQQAAGIAQSSSNASETQRRMDAQKEVIHVQAKQLEAASAERDALRVAGQRLRVQSAQYLATHGGGASCNSKPGATGETAGSAAMVYADLFSRADQAAGELAEALDRSQIAGAACVASYDSLTKN